MIWVIHFDPRGDPNNPGYREDERFRCRHVNFVSNTHVEDEAEYLFGAYSAFAVRKVHWKGGSRPVHIMELDPAYDKKSQEWSEDLDLAPSTLVLTDVQPAD